MKVIWFNKEATIKRLLEDKELGIFMATTIAKRIDKYVPMKKGALSGTYEIAPFKITYIQPYAKKMYNGDGFKFSKEKHPLATSKWDVVGMKSERGAVVSEINAYRKRGL